MIEYSITCELLLFRNRIISILDLFLLFIPAMYCQVPGPQSLPSRSPNSILWQIIRYFVQVVSWKLSFMNSYRIGFTPRWMKVTCNFRIINWALIAHVCSWPLSLMYTWNVLTGSSVKSSWSSFPKSLKLGKKI